MMRISPIGVELIKRFEGLELESYQDIAGIWTIGYGHTETAGPNQRITEDEAEALLRQDLVSRERAVSDLTNVSINQNEFDALVSFVYNVGANAYRGSTARRRLNGGNRLGAADALTWWNKSTVNGVLTPGNGRTRLRAAERALLLTPVEPPAMANNEDIRENSRVTPMEDPPRRGNLGDSRTIQGATVAGGAGVASSNMGRDSARELDELEERIESGTVMESGEMDVVGDDAAEAPADDPAPIAEDDAVDPPASAPVDEEEVDDGTVDDEAADDAAMDPCGPSDGDVDGEAEMSSDAEPSDVEDCEEPADGEAAERPAASSDPETSEGVLADAPVVPAAHDKHDAHAQLQLALMILIVLAVGYIIFARIEDWFSYKR
ncbi:MAG: glycoside hydrolase family protein [Parvularculaceae bacterium]